MDNVQNCVSYTGQQLIAIRRQNEFGVFFRTARLIGDTAVVYQYTFTLTTARKQATF
jgi:hypothetical protein